MVHNVFYIDIIKYTKEGFIFRYTSNHTADLNEGCLKTVDVFNCSKHICLLVQLSGSASSYCYFIFTEQKSCSNLLHCFFFSFTVLYFLATLTLDVGSLFYYCFWLWGRKEKGGWTHTLEMRLPNRNLCAVASLLTRHNLSSDCFTSCGEENLN